MKKKHTPTIFFASLVLLIFSLLLIHCNQNTSENDLKDTVLENFTSKIKDSWDVKVKEDSLIIESKDTMWIDFFNAAGISIVDKGQNKYSEKYLKENGNKIKAKIVFKLEPKWSEPKMQKAKNDNSLIYKNIDNLINKYELSHIERTNRWNEELFGNATEDEKKRIAIYKTEKRELLNKIIQIPLYNSEKYSLFIIDKNWEMKASYMIPKIFPKTEYDKIINLETLIEELTAQN